MSNTETDEEIQAESGFMPGGPLEKPAGAEVMESNGQTILFRPVLWLMWWTGTALIVLSWFQVVSNTVGWIGFAAALASTFISVMVNKYWKVPR